MEKAKMEIIIGNHLKMHLPHRLRERALRFYTGILGCRKLADIPYPNVDLYEFQEGFVLGLFFYDEADTLSEKEQLKATWMEIKTDRPDALKQRLIDFGVQEVEFEEKSRFYLQAPGGQVFRVAPMEGGL
jgi:catechol 2,3-dioxygenase-like lactoylglutathione lyase family enzyme